MGQYDTQYGNFGTTLYEQIRNDAFGQDIGQNSWLTAEEQDEVLSLLQLSAGKTLLDVACGAGGPALGIAAVTGCSVIGIDVHEQAIFAANALAAERHFTGAARFEVVDAARELPFPEATFDAITCIDGVNHLPDRRRTFGDWARLLKLRGRLLFTDPTILTGALTSEEIAVRSSVSTYLFVPLGYDERLLAESGLSLLAAQDRTESMAVIAERRRAARAARAAAVNDVEGEQRYAAHQAFLATVARLARERRLSRFLFVAEKRA